VEYRKIARPKD